MTEIFQDREDWIFIEDDIFNDESTIDECAMAYKPKEEILRRIGDTVDVVEVITPIWNFKASDMRK